MKFLILASLFVLSVVAEAEPKAEAEAKAEAKAEADPWYYQIHTGYYPHALNVLPYALPYMGHYTIAPQQTYNFYNAKSQHVASQGTATVFDNQGKPVEISNYPAKPLKHYMKMMKNVQTPASTYSYNTESSYNQYNTEDYNGYNPYNFGQNRVVREAEAEAEAEPEAEAEAEAEADPWYYAFNTGYYPQTMNVIPYSYPVMGYYTYSPENTNMATQYQYQYQAPTQNQYQAPTATASLYDQEGKPIEVQNFPALPLSYYMKMKKNDKTQATATFFNNEGRSLEINNYPAKPLQHYMKMLKNVQSATNYKNYNTDSSYNGYNNYNPIRTVREAGAEPEADAQYYYNYQAYPYHSYARTMYNRFPYTFRPYNAFNGYYYHY